jgi:hypothetical protein
MDKTELILLRAVMPQPYELVNNGTALWNPDMEWQLELDSFDTAKEVVEKMIAVNKAYGFTEGQCRVQLQIKKALGITEDIQAAVTSAVHAAIR